jgi:hypothetical protein
MSEHPLPATKPDDQPIEAGEVGELKDLPFHEAQHLAETARSLAKWLVWLLAAGLGVHYVLFCILAFGGKEESIKNLSAIFNAWLPVISSLLSAAATYYFTKDKR